MIYTWYIYIFPVLFLVAYSRFFPLLSCFLPFFVFAPFYALVRRFVDETTDLKLSQKGLVSRSTDLPLPEAFLTEEDIFRRLGLEFIPPHLRWA